jgi:hypothetical protein
MTLRSLSLGGEAREALACFCYERLELRICFVPHTRNPRVGLVWVPPTWPARARERRPAIERGLWSSWAFPTVL